MDIEYQTLRCQESNQKILLVKLSDGSSKKFSFNIKTMSFEPLSCSDCEPTQMDSDLTPRHTEWCPHTRNTVVFAYNHVLKMELKYRFDCESGSFHEIECNKCCMNPERTTDPKQIVLVATSPKSKRAIVLTMNKEGRVQKMQYDEDEKKYVDMEPTGIKALIERTTTLKSQESEMTKKLEKLNLNEKLIMESDLFPLYKTKSQYLPNDEILIAKNLKTDERGVYVFDRFIHQFLQINLPDVKIENDGYHITLPKLLFLTMSTKTQQAISIQHRPGVGELKKYHYNREKSIFEEMEESFIIQKDSDIQEWIANILESKDLRIQKNHSILNYLRNIKRFMVIQSIGKKPLSDSPNPSSSSIVNDSTPIVQSDTTDTEEPASSDTDSDDSSEFSFEMISDEEITRFNLE